MVPCKAEDGSKARKGSEVMGQSNCMLHLWGYLLHTVFRNHPIPCKSGRRMPSEVFSCNQSMSLGHEAALEQLQFDTLCCKWELVAWCDTSSGLLHANWFWYPVSLPFSVFLAQLLLHTLASQCLLLSSLWLLCSKVLMFIPPLFIFCWSWRRVAPVSPFYYSATCLPGSRLILVSLVDGLGIDFWDWFLVFSAAIVCSAENMCDGMQWFCNPVWVSLARKLASKNKMADVWKMWSH